ncbi:hypothetical protein F183_A11780 [Bryobacterales bacterium F-183]|nr:hypothetical protein F183_A11780 [Bryobacterales bacterium F-183]
MKLFALAALMGLATTGTASADVIHYSYSTGLEATNGPDTLGLTAAQRTLVTTSDRSAVYIDLFSTAALPRLSASVAVSGASFAGTSRQFLAGFPSVASSNGAPGSEFSTISTAIEGRTTLAGDGVDPSDSASAIPAATLEMVGGDLSAYLKNSAEISAVSIVPEPVLSGVLMCSAAGLLAVLVRGRRVSF